MNSLALIDDQRQGSDDQADLARLQTLLADGFMPFPDGAVQRLHNACPAESSSTRQQRAHFSPTASAKRAPIRQW
jgi:hypothetical protein